MGQAMALQLLAAEHELLTLSRHSSAPLQAAASASHCRLTQWSLDLGEPQTAAAQLAQWLGTLDASRYRSASLINNAGVIPEIKPFSALQASDIAQALRVGLEAPMLLSNAFVAATEGWSNVQRKVLNISSGLGRRPMASQAVYCTAKAGLDQFSRCLALEEALKPHGARVCALAPGVIDTDMQLHLRSAALQDFPDQGRFAQLHSAQQLTSAPAAAERVLAWLQRADFGDAVIADVRQP